MDFSHYLRGVILGFSIAAPVGPIGLLCIRRTLVDGRANGFISGLGAATADAVYGTIAAFGWTAISNLLTAHQGWLRFGGGLFLIYLGATTFCARPAEPAAAARRPQLVGAYLSTFILTVTNPMTILSFAAAFAGLGLGATEGDYGAAGAMVFGVFTGSALWWFLLSGGVGLFRRSFSARSLAWVNRISGVIIAGFGVLALLNP